MKLPCTLKELAEQLEEKDIIPTVQRVDTHIDDYPMGGSTYITIEAVDHGYRREKKTDPFDEAKEAV